MNFGTAYCAILRPGDLRHQYGISGDESQTSVFAFRTAFRTNERRLYSQAMNMYAFSSITLRRNLPRSQHFKPLAVFLRPQRTKAIPSKDDSHTPDSAKSETENKSVRHFEDIPGPRKSLKTFAEFFIKSDRFTKAYKLYDLLFERYGPVFKENMTFGIPTLHTIDPDDHEKVLRAEGKYPSRPIVDIWLEHRQRRNYFPGILLL